MKNPRITHNIIYSINNNNNLLEINRIILEEQKAYKFLLFLNH